MDVGETGNGNGWKLIEINGNVRGGGTYEYFETTNEAARQLGDVAILDADPGQFESRQLLQRRYNSRASGDLALAWCQWCTGNWLNEGEI